MHPKLINYLKSYKGENIKVFVEDIVVNCNGRVDSSEVPIVRVATKK